jgi:hypothetical protein
MNIEFCKHTGLVFVNGVPFTKESIERLERLFMDYDDQYTLSTIIEDQLTNRKVMITPEVLGSLVSYKDNAASEKDFN